MGPYLHLAALEGGLWYGILAGLMMNKHRRMQRMALRSFCSYTAVTLAKYPTSRGTHVRIGSLPALLKITSFRYGRWPRISTVTMMIWYLLPMKYLNLINLISLWVYTLSSFACRRIVT